MLALPDGYRLGNSNRVAKKAGHTMLGDEWHVTIYYMGYPAFELVKQYGDFDRAPRYSGRLVNGFMVGGVGDWQTFRHYTDAAKVMVAKHRILGGNHGNRRA